MTWPISMQYADELDSKNTGKKKWAKNCERDLLEWTKNN